MEDKAGISGKDFALKQKIKLNSHNFCFVFNVAFQEANVVFKMF
jgi:hypothetical protein